MCLMLLLVASKMDVVTRIQQNHNSVIIELAASLLAERHDESSKAIANVMHVFPLRSCIDHAPLSDSFILSYNADSSST
jgi:hypothetical protein